MLLKLLSAAGFAAFVAAAPAVLDVSENVSWTIAGTSSVHPTHILSSHLTPSPLPARLVVHVPSVEANSCIQRTTTATSSPTSTDLEGRAIDAPVFVTNLGNTTQLATEFPPSGNYVFSLTVQDGHPQTVGTLRGGDLYHEIYQALLGLCPDEKWNCWTWDGVTRKPPTFNWYKTITFDLIYRGHTYPGEGNLQIWVTKSEHSSNQIKRLLIGSICSTIQVAVKSLLNQPETFSHNIPHYIGLRSRAGDNMEVRFKALGQTDGNFDCQSAAQGAVNVLENLMAEWRSVMGNGQGGVWCQSK